MRLLSALLASAAAALAVNAAPNYEITKTAITIDKHAQALNNGDIVIRLHRTDDLFSDPTAFQDAKLLLEKNTHISLKIQLDPAAGTVNVNGEPLDIISSSAHDPKVTAIRAEALRLPAHHNAPLMDAQTMKDLLAQMSPGIVGVQVKVESENIAPSVPVSSPSEDDEDDDTSASQAITIRKVGLWIRVIEVEGQALPHATTTYTPILQLIVTGDGNRVDKIETLSINGDSPMEGAPGPMMIPSGMLPAKEENAAKVIPVVGSAYRGNFRPSRPPHRGPFHPVKKQGQPGFLAWLANLLGLSAPNPRIPFGLRGGGGRRGCKGMRLANTTRIGKHLETHRPMLENPFSGTMDDSAEETTIPQEKQRHSLKPYYGYGRHFYSHHGHSQHHHNGQGHHGRPCRIRAFFRNLGIGFVYGIALMATFFMHPYTLMSISGIAACALVFHVARRIAGKRRTGRVALPDEEDVDDDDEEEPLTDKEKQVLLESVMVVEERKSEDLPQYEEKSDQQRH